MSADAVKAQLDRFRADFRRLRREIGKVIVGNDEIVEGTLTALIAGGHVLLEGVPGLGKTLLVRTLADALRLKFQRIQFTPDLMPADLIGTNVVLETPEGGRRFEFQRGPVFANLLVRFPKAAEIETILDRTTEADEPHAEPVLDGERILAMTKLARQIPVADEIRRYGIGVVLATHPENERATPKVRRYVRYGSSPRGAQAMILAAKIRAILDHRYHVARADIRAV